jgi:hypothetical protein
MPASKLVSQLSVSGLTMPTSAVVGALCRGIVHRVRGGVDKLHGGAGDNVWQRGVCYRAAMIAQEWRQVHGFQLQTMHELAIRLHGKQVDICGVLTAVFGCSPQRALRPTSYLEVALLPFWPGLPIARLNSAYGRGRKDSRSNSLGDIFVAAAAGAP